MANKLLELFVEITTRGDADLTKRLAATEKQGAKTTKSLGKVEKSYSSLGDASSKAAKDHDALSSSMLDLDKSSRKASGGLGEVASNIKDLRTVTVAAAGVPALVAALGSLPAVALAGAGAIGQLALGLGQAGAGFALIGGPAVGGAVAGLKAYTAGIQSTVASSREAYEATHELRMEQLEQRRQQILNTEASIAFNEKVDESIIVLTELQAAIGNKVFPIFTDELDNWNEIISDMSPKIAETAGNVAALGAGFSLFLRTANEGETLRGIFDFINTSAVNGATALLNLGKAGVRFFELLIAPATRLQEELVDITKTIADWTAEEANMQRVAGIIALLDDRMRQAATAGANFALALVGVFQGLNAGGGVDRLMAGMVALSERWREVMFDTERGQNAIAQFMVFAQPALNQLWRLGGAAAREFGILANNVIKAGQGGGKMGTLAEVIRSLRESLGPLRVLFEDTFIALGPILADLVPEVAEFLATFLGQSGPLIAFLRSAERLLSIFNNLPDPVKNAVVQLVGLNAIMRALGGAGILSTAVAFGSLATNLAQTSAILGVAGKGGKGGLLARFGGLGGLLIRGGPIIAGLALAAGGIALIATKSEAAQKWLGSLQTKAGETASTLKDQLVSAAEEAGRALDDWTDTDTKAEPGTPMARQQLQGEQLGLRPPTGADMESGWSEAGEDIGRWIATGLKSILIGGGEGGGQGGTFNELGTQGATQFLTSFKKGFTDVDVDWGKLLFAAPTVDGKSGGGWGAVVDRLFGAGGGPAGLMGALAKKIPPINWSQLIFGKEPPGSSLKAGPLSQAVSRLLGTIGQRVNQFVQQAGQRWNKFWSGVGQRASQAAASVRARVQSFLQGVQQRWQQFTTGVAQRWNQFWSGVSQRASQFGNSVRQRIQSFLQGVQQRWQQFTTGVSQRWNQFWSGVSQRATQFANSIRTRIQTFLQGVQTRWQQFTTAVAARWNEFWSGVQKRAQEIASSVEERVRNFGENLVQTWNNIKSRAGEVWNAITGVITDASANAERNVKETWNRMLEFVAGVLDSLGFKDQASNVRGGKASMPAGEGGAGGPQGLRARGGVDYAARGGGFSKPRQPKQITWGEGEHEEAAIFITRDPRYRSDQERYMHEGAALLGGRYIPADRVPTHRRGERPGEGHRSRARRNPTPPSSARRMGRQEGFGPTMYTLIPELRKVAESVANEFGTPWNTYSNHPPGYPQPYYRERSVDWWGSGGRGSPIGSIWQSVANAAQSQLGSNLNWMLTPANDPAGHSDHVHVTAFAQGGGGASGVGGTTTGPNPQQQKFEREWRPVQKYSDERQRFHGSRDYNAEKGHGFLLGRETDAMRADIDARIPDTITTGGGQAGQYSGQGGTPEQNRQLGQKMLASSGTSGSWGALDTLWQRESGWNQYADNPDSDAYGIPQANPGSKMGPDANPPKSDPAAQIDWGLGYIAGRYGSTDAALGHSNSRGWYHDGGIVPGRNGQNVPAILEAGELVIPADVTAKLLAGAGRSFTIGGLLGNMSGGAGGVSGFAARIGAMAQGGDMAEMKAEIAGLRRDMRNLTVGLTDETIGKQAKANKETARGFADSPEGRDAQRQNDQTHERQMVGAGARPPRG